MDNTTTNSIDNNSLNAGREKAKEWAAILDDIYKNIEKLEDLACNEELQKFVNAVDVDEDTPDSTLLLRVMFTQENLRDHIRFSDIEVPMGDDAEAEENDNGN